jgi:hypothetical protein
MTSVDDKKFMASIAGINASIVEWQNAKGSLQEKDADKGVGDAIVHSASICTKPVCQKKLLEAKSKWKVATPPQKNQIITHLADAFLLKKTFSACIAGITGLSLLGIVGLTTAYQVADADGNLHEEHNVFHSDGWVLLHRSTHWKFTLVF